MYFGEFFHLLIADIKITGHFSLDKMAGIEKSLLATAFVENVT
jgi:hypothetical protein